MLWGGRRSGSGRKPRYSARAQTTQQSQQRWRFMQLWDTHTPAGDGLEPHPQRQERSVSPLQVPGSKGWLVSWFRHYLLCWRKPRLFIEAFAGSAVLGLTMVVEDRVGQLLLVEKDPAYVEVWQTALGSDAAWLSKQVLALAPRRDAIKAVLLQEPTRRRERAFQTLVKSRCYHRGRLTAGGGLLPNRPASKEGIALPQAWRPTEVVKGLRILQSIRRRVTVHHGCGLDVMAAHSDTRTTFTYADPPYPTAGTRMYVHGVIDMPALLGLCVKAQGPVVVSYADDPQAATLARQIGLNLITRTMRSGRNAPQRELLISNRPLPPEPAQTEDEAAK